MKKGGFKGLYLTCVLRGNSISSVVRDCGEPWLLLVSACHPSLCQSQPRCHCSTCRRLSRIAMAELPSLHVSLRAVHSVVVTEVRRRSLSAVVGPASSTSLTLPALPSGPLPFPAGGSLSAGAAGSGSGSGGGSVSGVLTRVRLARKPDSAVEWQSLPSPRSHALALAAHPSARPRSALRSHSPLGLLLQPVSLTLPARRLPSMPLARAPPTCCSGCSKPSSDSGSIRGGVRARALSQDRDVDDDAGGGGGGGGVGGSGGDTAMARWSATWSTAERMAMRYAEALGVEVEVTKAQVRGGGGMGQGKGGGGEAMAQAPG